MHTRGATSTTATMAYPSLPASPTLTNPDMILPYGDEYDSDPSPPQNVYEAEDDSWRRSSEDMQFSIGPAHVPLSSITPTTPIIYGNGTMLSDIGEVTEAESTPGRKLPGPAERRMLKQQAQATTVRSSPTLGYHSTTKQRMKVGIHERKISLESTSTMTSDAHATELFKDFDDGVSVDDSVFLGDDEESVADSYAEEVIAAETERLSRRDGNVGQDDDQNSSAALSRRAEQILLNAKKRLNNMEGNLTRARSSLYMTPSNSASSIHSSSPLTKSTPSPTNRVVAQLGLPTTKHRQLHTPADSPSSPGHTRVYSENSISPALRTTPFPVRSSSAAARYIGKANVETSKRSPILSHSPENARERPLPSPSSKIPPPRAQLDPLGENRTAPEFDTESVRSSIDEPRGAGGENPGLARSVSTMQMRDLRDQMHDLKGRLSVLRDRARDDTMKRRSLQSLRTPSPFTAAEQWYTGSKNYTDGALSADAGVSHPPWNETETKSNSSGEKPRSANEKEDVPHVSAYPASDATSVYEDVSEGHRALDEVVRHEPQELEEDYYHTAGYALAEDVDDDIDRDYNDEMVNHDELDDYESDVSLYHDTLTTPLSHEDREDAFDYEHFFLHSAMGTISQQRHGRRDSVGSYSSNDSVETTRGPIASKGLSERPSASHLRSGSTDSISTMATFATATEGRRSVDEDETDEFAVQHVITPSLRTTTPVTAKRSTFGSPVKNGLPNDRQPTPDDLSLPSSVFQDRNRSNGSSIHHPLVAPSDSFESTGTSRSFPLVNKPRDQNSLNSDMRASRQSGSILSQSTTLIDGQVVADRMQPSPVHMLARDDQILVERLVASLGKCVLGLQEAGNRSHESKSWRSRLDSARRILEGEE